MRLTHPIVWPKVCLVSAFYSIYFVILSVVGNTHDWNRLEVPVIRLSWTYTTDEQMAFEGVKLFFIYRIHYSFIFGPKDLSFLTVILLMLFLTIINYILCLQRKRTVSGSKIYINFLVCILVTVSKVILLIKFLFYRYVLFIPLSFLGCCDYFQ